MKLAEKESVKAMSEDNPCVCFNIRKAARAITQIYDDMFKGVGLSSSQAAILQKINKAGLLTVNQMAEAMSTDRTTITRNLKLLVRDGLISIRAGEDKRERVVEITQRGKLKSEATMAIWQKFQKKVDKNVGREKMERVCDDLSKMMDEIKAIS